MADSVVSIRAHFPLLFSRHTAQLQTISVRFLEIDVGANYSICLRCLYRTFPLSRQLVPHRRRARDSVCCSVSSAVAFFPLSSGKVSRLIFIRFCSSTLVEVDPSWRVSLKFFSLSSESILTFGFFSRRVRKKGSPTVSDSHFSAFRSGEFVSNRCVLPRAIVSIVSIAELRRTLN